jgi:hypothetical protein
MIQVRQTPSGWWVVVIDGIETMNAFKTQAEAWEWIDRNEVHPLHERTATATKWKLKGHA